MPRPFNDLTDQVFGYLTVLKFIKNDPSAIWLVKCSAENCGKEIEVRADRLTSKIDPVTHCGCLTGNNLLGQTFGYLIVLDYVRTEKKNGRIWLIKCCAENCGKEIEVLGSRLTRKTNPMIHCGCLSAQLYSNAKKGKKYAVTHGQSKTKEYWVERSHNYRIKHRNLSGSIPAYLGSVKESRSKLNYCVYCGSKTKLSTDHILPIARGGTNDPKNLITACLYCNSSKKDLLFIDWYTPKKNFKRQLHLILKDMGFDSLEHFNNYFSL